MEIILRNKADFFQKNVFYLLFYQIYQTILVCRKIKIIIYYFIYIFIILIPL